MARSLARSSTQYLSLSSAVLTAAPITMACWVYPTTIGSAGALTAMSLSRTNTNNNIFNLDLGDFLAGDPVRAVAIESSSIVGVASTTTGYSTNEWQHIAAVFASSTSRSAYRNGTAKSTNTSSVSPSGVNATYIGAWYTGAGGSLDAAAFFDGRVCEAGIWNAALDDAEIAALADGYSPLLIRPASLVAYWPLGGRYGQSDRDRWRNGYDLTANNSPTWTDHPRIVYPQPMVLPFKTTGGGGGGVANPVLFHSYYMSQGMRP